MFDLSGKPKRGRKKDPFVLNIEPFPLFPSTKKTKRGYIPSDYEHKLLQRQKEKCAHCKKPLRPKLYHLDHKVAKALKGSDTLRNLQLLCPECHHKKTAEDQRKIAAKRKRDRRKDSLQPFKL
ncbi:MAG: HNH endonuclease [Thaumarchaeota archaeon]|nr:HNH endonuclease [Nitrososphaerota archaeon]